MRSLFLLAALVPLAVSAQKNSNPQTYAKTITAADLKKHLYIVAGPEMEGRETATRGERLAAEYISNHFIRLGVLPGNNGKYLMPFPLYRDSLISAMLKINDRSYELGEHFNLTGGSHNESMNFSNIIYIGSSNYDSLKKANIYGKLVMSHDYAALRSAFMNGAAAGLLIQPDFRRGTVERTGHLMREKFQMSVAPHIFTVSEEIAKSVIGDGYDSLMTAGKNKNYKPALFSANVEMGVNKQTSDLFANNVLGMIEGTDRKDEYVFITAHYDHEGKRSNGTIYYGADDDGSGTVTILELAEAFAKAKAEGNGPRRTIVFMTVSGEEKGLWGSDYYSSHPVFPLEKTTVDLNIDMIGRIDPGYKGDSLNYIYTIGENKLSSDLEAITNTINKKYSRLQIDRKFSDPKDPNRFYYRSDHYNFAKKGVPIIFYFNGVHADYHRPTDTPDKITYPLMEKRARLIFHTAWEIANRDEMLKRDIPLD